MNPFGLIMYLLNSVFRILVCNRRIEEMLHCLLFDVLLLYEFEACNFLSDLAIIFVFLYLFILFGVTYIMYVVHCYIFQLPFQEQNELLQEKLSIANIARPNANKHLEEHLSICLVSKKGLKSSCDHSRQSEFELCKLPTSPA